MVVNSEKIILNENVPIRGCFVLVPIFNSNDEAQINSGALYLSEKVVNGLFAKLYILGEVVEGFEEVYSDNIPLGFYGGRPIGPVKIWKINYPDAIEEDMVLRSDSTIYDSAFRLAK